MSPPTRDLSAEAAEAIPVTLLTGFLGSGKTTLLNALLQHPDMGETAVLINEFGEIGLDHLLVEKVDDDIIMLNSGCLCCSVRGDLLDSLRGLFQKRVRMQVPEFTRVVIETTGLADPAPILHTLMTDPVLTSRYRLDGVVTTIDAVNGESTLNAHREAVKQIAVADRVIITKTDLAPEETLTLLQHRLNAINPAAPREMSVMGNINPNAILNCGLFQPNQKIPDVAAWLKAEALEDSRHQTDHLHHHSHDHGHVHGQAHGLAHDHIHDVNRHDDRVRAFVVTLKQPVVWEDFAAAMDLLLATKGENLLRIKGLLNVAGENQPIVIHGVQHVFHPPISLPVWPPEYDTADSPTGAISKLVFITRDLSEQAVKQVLAASLGVDLGMDLDVEIDM